MILTTQRLPPIKNNLNIKSNISSIESPKNLCFPEIDKLKKFKKKISPIINSDNINLRINTSPSHKSENESKIQESNIKRKIIFYPNSVNKKLIKSDIIEEEEISKKNVFKILKDGNDPSTILKCFEHRINWKNADSNNNKNEKINFIWAPLWSQIDFNEIGYDSNKIRIMCNHFTNQNQLSNKLNCFKNLMTYCEENYLDIFKYVPLTILIQYESPLFLRQIKTFEYFFNNINKYIITDSNQSKSLQNWKKKYGTYFYLDNDYDSKVGLRTNLYISKNHYDGKNLWLLKAMNLNRGLAIKIIDSFEECHNYIKSYYQGGIIKCVKNYNSNSNILNNNENKSNIDNESFDNNKKIYFKLPKIVTTTKNGRKNYNFKNNHDFCLYRQIDYYSLLKKSKEEKERHYQSGKLLLQKYIEKPLLYNKRKFDMRTWVLLTHDMKIYLFKEGHLKASSSEYDINSKDIFVHLTNYSVQKYSEKFENYEIGNEISLDEFQKSLYLNYGLDINIKKEIINKIGEIIILTLNSVKKKINPEGKKGCFEIFGYDFMFDIDLNPFLIEINTNPGLEISSPLISKLVPRMIDDAFRLTIDKVFGTEYSPDRYRHNDKDNINEYISPFHVEGYDDSENMFIFLGNLGKKQIDIITKI